MNTPFIYKNKRAVTLHLVGLLTLAMPMFTIIMIFKDFQNFLSEFSARHSGIAWAIFFITISSSTLIAMIWLSGRYVLSIVKSTRDEELIELKIWTFLGFYQTRSYPKSILQDTQFNPGKGFYGRGPSINAPWLQLKTPGGKTLVVDMQGEFLEGFF